MIKYGDPDRMSSSWLSRPAEFSTGDIVIERLLVSNVAVAKADAPQRALMASPRFLQVDFEDFEVLGATVCPMSVGDTVSGVTIGQDGSYLVDVVFRMSNWEIEYIDTGKQEAQAALALQEGGFTGTSIPIVRFIAAQDISFATPSEMIPARDFWAKQLGLLIQRQGQQPAMTDAYQSGYVAKTWGKQISFGLADYPDTLEPYVVGSLLTPTPGGGVVPRFQWPGSSGKAPSSSNLLVWGLFAAGGFMLAREAWKAWR